MRTVSVTLSTPSSHRSTTMTVRGRTKLDLQAQITNVIRGFASRHGISPRSIEYALCIAAD
jgi:hypothetical protein